MAKVILNEKESYLIETGHITIYTDDIYFCGADDIFDLGYKYEEVKEADSVTLKFEKPVKITIKRRKSDTMV